MTLPALSAILLWIAMAGCGRGQKDILSTIPATSKMVACVDIDRLVSQGGLSGSDALLAAEYSGLLDKMTDGLSTALLALDDAVDTRCVLLCMTETGTEFCTFGLQGTPIADKFDTDPTTSGAFKAWEIAQGTTLVVRDSQGWLLPFAPVKALDTVSDICKIAATASLSELDGVAQALDDSQWAVRAVLRGYGLPSGSRTDHWLTVTANADRSEIAGQSTLITPDGQVVSLTDLQNIDTDFLRYVPADMAFVGAIGLTPNFDWKQLAPVASMIGAESRAMFEMAAPLLSKIEGTAAVAIGPRDSAAWQDPLGPGWDFLVMAHMPQREIDQTIESLSSLAELYTGSSLRAGRNGLATLNIMGRTINIGNVDGNLAISTLPLTGRAENSLTETFAQRRAAVAIDIPSGIDAPTLPHGTDQGLSLRLSTDNDCTSFRLSFPDSEQPAPVCLFTLLWNGL